MIFQRLKKFYQSPRKFVITAILAVAVIVMGAYSIRERDSRQKLVYAESLDKKVLTVNGRDFNLRQLAFYVAYEEMQVEEEALVYQPSDPGKYWNLHVDGVFVKVAARNAAIQMAIHDAIFYEMAMDEGIELNEEQVQALENDEEDFWNDLQDYDGAERMGITREDIHETMERIAYAQWYQTIYARIMNKEYEDYDFTKEDYTDLLDKNTYKIYDGVWERVDFGNVILR